MCAINIRFFTIPGEVLKACCNLMFGISVGLWLSGCATPSEQFAAVADEKGFYPISVATASFEHQIYFNRLAKHKFDQEILHVYLDGDGTPWVQRRWIAKDPTSRNPLILDLMALDQQPAILLGRPCYHGYSVSPQCHYKFWTSHRYSQQVVDSMAAALKTLLKEYGFSHVSLIGFSGGGALALLIAPEIPEVKTVVTIAANLNVDAWSRHHGYKPLQESLNPSNQAVSSNVKQIHIVGANDKVVPPFVVESYMDKQNVKSTYLIYDNYDHFCCWSEKWDEILHLF